MPDPLNPAMAYGVGKRCAEHLCSIYTEAYGLETVIARCFAFVGPDLPQNAHFAIGNFIRDAIRSNKITVYGDGSPMRSFLDQRDLAYWLNQLLINGLNGRAYNVGSDVQISVLDLAYLVRETLAPDKPVIVLGNNSPLQSRNIYVPDITKAKTELALSVNVNLQDAILHAATN